MMPDKRSAVLSERGSREECPSAFPADKKRTEVTKVIKAVAAKEMPPRLALTPMPILLQESESPSRSVVRSESGRRGASAAAGSRI